MNKTTPAKRACIKDECLTIIDGLDRTGGIPHTAHGVTQPAGARMAILEAFPHMNRNAISENIWYWIKTAGDRGVN